MQDSLPFSRKRTATSPFSKLLQSDLSLHDDSTLLTDLALVPPGASFAVFIRHAERPGLNLFVFERNIQITPHGKAESQKLGRALASRGLNGVVSSPVLRCQQTSKEIMTGAGIDHLRITTRASLGEPGAYIINPLLAFVYFIQSGVPEVIRKYTEQGEMSGFLPLKDRSAKILGEIVSDLSKKDARLLFLSHDAVVIPLITFFTGEKFGPDRWIGYLDGFVIAVAGGEVSLIRRGKIHAIDKGLLCTDAAVDGCFFTEE